MNKIIIDPHYCTQEEYQDLRSYLIDNNWDWKIVEEPKTKTQFESRCEELTELKMKPFDDGFVGANNLNADFNINSSEIICDTKVQWTRKLHKLKLELNIREENESKTTSKISR